MADPAAYPLPRERNLILGLLIALTAVAWAILVWQAAAPADMQMSLGLTMGWGAPVFLGMWVAMMVAMMFPTAAPMILTFARVHAGKRERGQTFVPTWVFVAGYLIVWIGFGALAFAAAALAEALADRSMAVMEVAPRIGGLILILAGVYQLTPLKNACLAQCRTPISFIMTSWREGYRGALIMGLQHGVYCLGCCWLLFVILFPLGIMNLAAMLAITLLIFAEKSLAIGPLAGKVAAALLILYGVAVWFVPGILPTVMTM